MVEDKKQLENATPVKTSITRDKKDEVKAGLDLGREKPLPETGD